MIPLLINMCIADFEQRILFSASLFSTQKSVVIYDFALNNTAY
jgi:hypothetical protein